MLITPILEWHLFVGVPFNGRLSGSAALEKWGERIGEYVETGLHEVVDVRGEEIGCSAEEDFANGDASQACKECFDSCGISVEPMGLVPVDFGAGLGVKGDVCCGKTGYDDAVRDWKR